MGVSDKMAERINFQINREFFSAYLYRAIANYYEYEGFSGFSHWYNVQATEEKEHSILMMQYLLDNGCRVKLAAVEAPEDNFADYIAPVQKAYEHEQLVTSYIDAIYKQAMDERDFRTMNFFDFFIAEQGEEEKNAAEMLRKVRVMGSDMKSMYLMDAQLKQRPYVPMDGIRSGVVN